jgi:hypothetical protein
MCSHIPACPPADRSDRMTAQAIVSHPEQGWSLLCNGVVLFEDFGALLPDGSVLEPPRPVLADASGDSADWPPSDIARQRDGATGSPVAWDHSRGFSGGVGMMAAGVSAGQGVAVSGVETGLLLTPAGLAVDDEFVGGGLEPASTAARRSASPANQPHRPDRVQR